MPEVLEEAMEVKVGPGGFPLLGWSVAGEVCDDRDAQQVWSFGGNASREWVRVASSVCFFHEWAVRLLELEAIGWRNGRRKLKKLRKVERKRGCKSFVEQSVMKDNNNEHFWLPVPDQIWESHNFLISGDDLGLATPLLN